MKIKRTIEKVPGGLMVVPLLLGALLNTIDQAHFPVVQDALRRMGGTPLAAKDGRVALFGADGKEVKIPSGSELRTETDGAVTTLTREIRVEPDGSASVVNTAKRQPSKSDAEGGKLPTESVTATPAPGRPQYEFLRIGGFFEPLFKTGALVLIGLFLVCVGAQMNPRVGGRALKKGGLLMGTKFAAGLAIGWAFGKLSDPYHGWLGLSTLAIIAAINNDNGGLYAALTRQFGNRSDTGALAVISINDGPFLTLVSLGILGHAFPFTVFAAVLIPVALGMVLGNLDHDVRAMLAPGETLLIPFFAFALGAGMNFATFANTKVLAGGLVLGVGTVAVTAVTCGLVFRLFGERSLIAPMAEASTAGNAATVPVAVAAAAAEAVRAGWMPAFKADAFKSIVESATAQVTISVLVTSILCPLAVILMDRWQRRRGIDGRAEDPRRGPSLGPGPLAPVVITPDGEARIARAAGGEEAPV